MSGVTYTACPYCSKTFALSDSRIRELEARLAACVGALEKLLTVTRSLPPGDTYSAARHDAELEAEYALDGPDLAPWRAMIEAVRTLVSARTAYEAAGGLSGAPPYIALDYQNALRELDNAARRAGLGAER